MYINYNQERIDHLCDSRQIEGSAERVPHKADHIGQTSSDDEIDRTSSGVAVINHNTDDRALAP
jgi:hypothetical protein